MGDALYLYFDEAGNFDFSENGTDYFIMTCVAMRRPFSCASSLLSYKYDCIERGLRMSKFHACEDNRHVRAEVFGRISEHCSRCNAYCARVRKSHLSGKLANAAIAYSIVFEWAICEVLDHEDMDGIKQIVAVTDSLPQEARRRKVEKPLKAIMKRRFQDLGIPYTLLHCKSESDLNLQIADYLCWAAYRSFVNEEYELPEAASSMFVANDEVWVA